MPLPFLRRKKKDAMEDEMPGELDRIRRELRPAFPKPEDVPEDELGEPLVRNEDREVSGFDITIPRKRPEIPPELEPMGGPLPEREKPREPSRRHEDDRLELILSKLDTIDARLKLIEEKLKRF